jgi:hypothetical protein
MHANSGLPLTALSRKNRTEAMVNRAYELARQGHRSQMIEAVLAANGFPAAGPTPVSLAHAPEQFLRVFNFSL